MTKCTNIFREKGIKITPQRISVYNTLSGLFHASVEEIASRVSIENPTITTATVYNILNCLADNGIITRLSTPMGKIYYDISTHRHHHIFCGDGTIHDYNSLELNQVIDNHFAENPLVNYEIITSGLQMTGNQILK